MKLKSILGYAAIVLSILAMATGLFVSTYERPRDFADSRETGAMLEEIGRYVKENGVTPDLDSLLADIKKPDLWLATVVTARDLGEREDRFAGFNDQIVAAADPLMVGLRTPDAFTWASRGLDGRFEGLDSANLTVVSTDGTTYSITTLGRRYGGYAYYARIGFMASFLGAWIAIAGWVVADVRQHQATGVIGWTLLSLLTGPVALGVWLTTRPIAKSRPCPGCGSQVPTGMAHCVRCGHPIEATCTKCGKTVDVEWAYCGACGAPLKGED